MKVDFGDVRGDPPWMLLNRRPLPIWNVQTLRKSYENRSKRSCSTKFPLYRADYHHLTMQRRGEPLGAPSPKRPRLRVTPDVRAPSFVAVSVLSLDQPQETPSLPHSAVI